MILHETIPAKIRHLLCTGPETAVGPLSELEFYRIGLAGLPRRSPDKSWVWCFEGKTTEARMAAFAGWGNITSDDHARASTAYVSGQSLHSGGGRLRVRGLRWQLHLKNVAKLILYTGVMVRRPLKPRVGNSDKMVLIDLSSSAN